MERVHNLVSRKRHQGVQPNLCFGNKTAYNDPDGKNHLLANLVDEDKGIITLPQVPVLQVYGFWGTIMKMLVTY